MNEYLQNLVNNVARLYDLSIKLNNSPIVKANHPESVEKLSEFLRYLYERISILVKLPQRLTIEDNFYPFSTYAAFIQNNNDNKDFLEDLSYAIDEIVKKLRETPIFDKDHAIKSLPRTQIDKVFKLIEDYDLQKIKEIADKLSENI
ncbi:MAG: hypothetical protein FJ368_05995, partial [Pelagibacterales bacterium]|nr:hypothetical protein [Pelagibacterales bacterium]